MPAVTPDELKTRLARLLEVHNGTKILEAEDGALKMHMQFARNNKKKTHKDRIINFCLGALESRLLVPRPEERDLIIAEFLIDEMRAYYKKQL